MNKEELYEQFINLYPISRLKNLKLEEYTNTAKNSFCYWVENKLNEWGNIHGATSYKFGIFQWGNKPALKKTNILADEKYTWLNRFGKTAEEAYLNIRGKIVEIAESAERGEYSKIDSIGISEMFKWKIAFLYSNKKLINWFSREALIEFANYFGKEVNDKTSTSELQRILLEEKGEKDLEEFNKILSPIWQAHHSSEEWLPKNYNPNISKEKWIELINDKTIFTENALITFACLQEASIPTCTDMAKEFGRTKNFYNNNIWRTGERVYTKINCPLSERETGENRYWPICCIARNLKNGLFEFKIRQELQEAFEESGVLNDIDLYGDKGEPFMSKTEELIELLKTNYNLILHGAPGTGKTHLAKEIAKKMGCNDSEIGFVQFHPSYDYTDFVEGLRPVEGANGVVGFERKDGVFKDFCAKALKNLLDSQKTIETVKAELSNKERIDAFLSKCIADGEPFKTAKENTFYVSSFTEKHVIISYKNKEDTISDKVKIKYSDLLTLIKEDRKIERTEVKKLTGRSVERQEDTYSTILINKLLEEPQETIEQPEQSNKEKNYVFIIDEINRGELSKIFGELFFSIDPGYRGFDETGKPKGIVKTQYQNLVEDDDIFADGFYIPDNVYIIGTMNDIDRSVESMDFAMRRRFVFEEVTAEDSAKNMNLSQEATDRMTRINAVIHDTEGLNDAYKIGGAYFLDVTDFDQLWKIKLSSLIKEYLRGIDDDGSKFKKIQDAYFNNETDSLSDNDE
ncbi:MAG: AAA family ATPase [Treponema sp.]|uniref:McrB family protein n=1 Tax=Treponema sp. TaxID=166 RepID=UPI00298DD78C|nr:AAA family ATPase [Treponema sp.]MBR5932508.1 AAA family ATPase [Treponema sp.]